MIDRRMFVILYADLLVFLSSGAIWAMRHNTEGFRKRSMSDIVSLIQYDLSSPLDETQVEAALERVKGGDRDVRGGRYTSPLHKRVLWYSNWAALVIGAVMLVVWGSAGVWGTEERISTYSTPPGAQALVQLPDGSEVTLNASSILTVPSSFGKKDRKLTLVGEGYFRVVNSSKAPFTVHSLHTISRVLGTEFIVRDYPYDTDRVVSVKSGRVSVDGAIVSAGERYIWTQSSGSRIDNSTPADFSFLYGELTLDDLTLIEAIPHLNRWYGVSVVIASPELHDMGIGGTLSRGSVHDLATILRMTYKLDAVVSGNTLTLYKASNE